MIIDSITNANFYSIKKIQEVLNFIVSHDFSQEKAGKYMVENSDVFYMMHEKETSAVTDSFWESHKIYTDIYYIIEGSEVVCYTKPEDLKIKTPYDEQKDLVLYEHTGTGLVNPVLLNTKHFMVLRPGEVHMANISPVQGKNNRVKKAIFKIKI